MMTFTREPENILKNIEQDYIDELASSKLNNPNVTSVIFAVMIILDKEAKLSEAQKLMKKNDFIQMLKDVKNGKSLTPL